MGVAHNHLSPGSVCACVNMCIIVVQVLRVAHTQTESCRKLFCNIHAWCFYLLSQKLANPSVALIPLILQPEWRRLGEKSDLVPENTVRGAVGSRPLVSEQLQTTRCCDAAVARRVYFPSFHFFSEVCMFCRSQVKKVFVTAVVKSANNGCVLVVLVHCLLKVFLHTTPPQKGLVLKVDRLEPPAGGAFLVGGAERSRNQIRSEAAQRL